MRRTIDGAIALAVLVGWMLACGADTEPSTLKADVQASSLNVKIRNIDDRDWSNIDVSVNPDSVGYGGFKAHLDALAKGDEHVFPLVSMTDREGNRFSPLAKAVVRVRVDAATGRQSARESLLVNK